MTDVDSGGEATEMATTEGPSTAAEKEVTSAAETTVAEAAPVISEGLSGDAAAEEAPKAPTEAKIRWTTSRVQAVLEALLFASPDPLTMRSLQRILPDSEVDSAMITDGFDALRKRYESSHSGIVLAEIAGGWQIQTREDYFSWVQKLAKTRSEERLTQAALETLAIVAYKQPITRAEVDAVRGVGSGQLIRTLMDRNLVKVVGRVELPGRPFQYGTTQHFLEHFGLASLADLPKEKEL